MKIAVFNFTLGLLLATSISRAEEALNFDLEVPNTPPTASDFVNSLENDLGRRPESFNEATASKSQENLQTPSREPASVEEVTHPGEVELTSGAPLNAKERRDLFIKTIGKNFPEFKKCYQQGLQNNAEMKGRVSMNWRLDSQGKVVDPKVTSSELKNPKVERCLTTAILDWRFSPSVKTGGAKDRLSYTFEFLPE